MLLTGTFHRSLDQKCRFSLPKSIRDALQDQTGNLVLYLAPGTDGSLAIYTEGAFKQLGTQLGQGPPTSQGVRSFSRLFYAQAERVEVDRQGRIRIPSGLASLASLKKDIVLLGVRDHLEIWDRACWEVYLGEKQRTYDQIAEKAFDSG